MKTLPLLVVTFALATIGCHSATSTSPSDRTTSDSTASGAFHFTIDGTTYDRAHYPADWHVAASAQLHRDQTGGTDDQLLVNLTLLDGGTANYAIRTLEIVVWRHPTFLGTHPFVPVNSYATDASVQLDSNMYTGANAGTLVITKFDTVNNLVSGTFNFDVTGPGRYSTNPMHVTSGYFNDVQIDFGSYDQGTISAMIDGVPFRSDAKGGFSGISAYSDAGVNVTAIEINTYDGLTFNGADLGFGLFTTDTGTYTLAAGQNKIMASFFSPLSHSQPLTTASGATGTMKLSNVDRVNHRFSATFEFSGPDSTTGKTIHITNGVIDNVRWAVY